MEDLEKQNKRKLIANGEIRTHEDHSTEINPDVQQVSQSYSLELSALTTRPHLLLIQVVSSKLIYNPFQSVAFNFEEYLPPAVPIPLKNAASSIRTSS